MTGYAYLLLVLAAFAVAPLTPVAAQDGPEAETTACPSDAMASDKEGFACMKSFELPDMSPYVVYWTVDGTLLTMAMEGETDGWVGIAFASSAGSMVPSDFVIGYVDGDTVTVSPYFADSRSVTAFTAQNEVELSDVGGEEVDGKTTIYFTRDTAQEGTVPIDLTAETAINYALGPGDELAYHMTRRESGTITFSA